MTSFTLFTFLACAFPTGAALLIKSTLSILVIAVCCVCCYCGRQRFVYITQLCMTSVFRDPGFV